MTDSLIRKRLAMAGALLFFVGMVTGLWAAVTLTGTVVVGIPRLALIAHLNGLLGGLWLLAVAWSLEFLHYGETGCADWRLGWRFPAGQTGSLPCLHRFWGWLV